MGENFQGMPEIEKPLYLYQYTSIQTLALILKSQQIRLNSLKNVDDLEEIETSEIKDFGKYTFASCWTNDDKENIALWNMYTKEMSGIRIRLPYDCVEENKQMILDQINEYQLDLIEFYREQLTSDGYNNDPKKRFYQIRQIQYTDQNYKLIPKVWDNYSNYPSAIKLGEYKRTQWEFQKEWRYVIYTFPIKAYDYKENRQAMIGFFESHDSTPQSLFLNIKEEAFKDIEIVLGPNTTYADRIIVESLIDKYNPSAKLSDSYFKGKVRNKL